MHFIQGNDMIVRSNKIVANLVEIADPFINFSSLLYILFSQILCAIIYPTLELVVQFPVTIIFCFFLYMLILDKHKKLFEKIDCCVKLKRFSCCYRILLFALRDRLVRNQILKKLRVPIVILLAILAIVSSALRTSGLYIFSSPMYYDSEDLSSDQKNVYKVFYISILILMWFILSYQVMYGLARYIIFLAIYLIFCPCLLVVVLRDRNNATHIESDQVPVNPDQDLIDQGYTGPILYIKKQRQQIQEWIDMVRMRFSQVQRLVEGQSNQMVAQQQNKNEGGYMGFNCSICLNQFKPRDFIIQLKCNQMHIFHHDCLKVWALSKFTCPLCRKNIIKPFEDEQQLTIQQNPGSQQPYNLVALNNEVQTIQSLQHPFVHSDQIQILQPPFNEVTNQLRQNLPLRQVIIPQISQQNSFQYQKTQQFLRDEKMDFDYLNDPNLLEQLHEEAKEEENISELSKPYRSDNDGFENQIDQVLSIQDTLTPQIVKNIIIGQNGKQTIKSINFTPQLQREKSLRNQPDQHLDKKFLNDLAKSNDYNKNFNYSMNIGQDDVNFNLAKSQPFQSQLENQLNQDEDDQNLQEMINGDSS